MRRWCGTAALLAGAAAACGQVLFQDDFNDGNADGWTEYDCCFGVSSGEYRISGGTDPRTVAGDYAWSDYAIDADFMLWTYQGHASVFFRVNPGEPWPGPPPDTPSYRCQISRGGIELWKDSYFDKRVVIEGAYYPVP